MLCVSHVYGKFCSVLVSMLVNCSLIGVTWLVYGSLSNNVRMCIPCVCGVVSYAHVLALM